MQQISQYRAGERDYRKLGGNTGPLVYPAGHVYIYDWLYQLTAGGGGRATAQAIFCGAYIVTYGLVMLCYLQAKAPPWTLIVLSFSKRLHSIYLLRLFNDCYSTLLIMVAICLLQREQDALSALFCSLSVAVKMSSILYLPAFGVIFLLRGGLWRAMRLGCLMLQLQFLLSLPFIISRTGTPSGYLNGAFDFRRVFQWIWTVNWRFLGEGWFHSTILRYALLGAHVSLLLLFSMGRWLGPLRYDAAGRIQWPLLWRITDKAQRRTTLRGINSTYVLDALYTSNLIGVLCARSLHYQFYCWIAWATPYMIWRSGWGPAAVFSVWLAQEWAWNVYPSTTASSATVVTCLALQIAGMWVGTGAPPVYADKQKQLSKKKE